MCCNFALQTTSLFHTCVELEQFTLNAQMFVFFVFNVPKNICDITVFFVNKSHEKTQTNNEITNKYSKILI